MTNVPVPRHPPVGLSPLQEAVQAILRERAAAVEIANDRCPTCGSRTPLMHPAAGGGGEVNLLCPDPFHGGTETALSAHEHNAQILRRLSERERVAVAGAAALVAGDANDMAATAAALDRMVDAAAALEVAVEVTMNREEVRERIEAGGRKESLRNRAQAERGGLERLKEDQALQLEASEVTAALRSYSRRLFDLARDPNWITGREEAAGLARYVADDLARIAGYVADPNKQEE